MNDSALQLFDNLPAHVEAALRASIERFGVLVAVAKDQHGRTIDGHQRARIADELGVSYRVDTIVVADEVEAREIALTLNADRRQLTPEQRVMVATELRAQGHSYRAIGGALGVSHETIREDLSGVNQLTPAPPRARGLDGKSYPAKRPAVVAGASSRAEVLEASKQIRLERAEERRQEIAEVRSRAIESPAGTYGVIVIDPPWPMQKIPRDVRPNQLPDLDYPTMTEDELSALEIPCADDAHVFVWTTHKFLPMAFRLLDSWGLHYVCTFVWHKPGGFQPIGLPQYNCEFALYARRGAPEFIDTKAFPVCFDAARGVHSEKPEEFYSTLRRVTSGRRLDMFNRRPIDGFTTWGNEATA